MSAIAKKYILKKIIIIIYIKKKNSLRPRCAIDQNAFRFPGRRPNMADARIRNSDREDDNDLNDDLAKFVSLNLKRMEILDFLRKDYPILETETLPRQLHRFPHEIST